MISDGEFVHLGDEGGVGESELGLVEEWVGDEGVFGGGAVGEVETDGDVGGGGVGGIGDGGVGEELKGHGGGVVDDAGEIWGEAGEAGESEEGEEGGVRAELDGDWDGGSAGDGGVELLETSMC